VGVTGVSGFVYGLDKCRIRELGTKQALPFRFDAVSVQLVVKSLMLIESLCEQAKLSRLCDASLNMTQLGESGSEYGEEGVVRKPPDEIELFRPDVSLVR
jgi:hypothetical protein